MLFMVFLYGFGSCLMGSLDDDHGSYGTISHDASSSNFETVLTSSPKYFLGLQNTILSPHSKSNPNTTPHHSKVTIDSFLATKFSPHGSIWYTTLSPNTTNKSIHNPSTSSSKSHLCKDLFIFARVRTVFLDLNSYEKMNIIAPHQCCHYKSHFHLVRYELVQTYLFISLL